MAEKSDIPAHVIPRPESCGDRLDSHAARPGVVQTISGSWTEGRAAGEGVEPILTDYPAGKKEALLETWDTEHWGWNTGSEPAHFLACDLAPPS